MSDERVEQGASQDAASGPNGNGPEPDGDVSGTAGDGNTGVRKPDVTGGQPAVGEDLPRNTEF